jgi:stearoyl-CoA desaturase (delta-9 desaturase)
MASSTTTHSTVISTRTRAINFVAVVVPFAVTAAAVPMFWGSLVSWFDIVLLMSLYGVSMLGVTVGYHRLLTHRSFETYPWLRGALAVCGCTAVQGPPIIWVADHRQHHAFADEDGDPHSPHTHGAHVGWLLTPQHSPEPLRYARDLLREPFMRALSRYYLLVVLISLLVPAFVGGLAAGSARGALTGLLWGGFIRVFFVHHVTWSVNSLGHYAGRRRFDTKDRSTNVALLAVPSFGDSWHHNHHAFPTSAWHGFRWWEIDPGGLIINALERVGLAWDVVRHTDAEISRKEATATT